MFLLAQCGQPGKAGQHPHFAKAFNPDQMTHKPRQPIGDCLNLYLEVAVRDTLGRGGDKPSVFFGAQIGFRPLLIAFKDAADLRFHLAQGHGGALPFLHQLIIFDHAADIGRITKCLKGFPILFLTDELGEFIAKGRDVDGAFHIGKPGIGRAALNNGGGVDAGLAVGKRQPGTAAHAAVADPFEGVGAICLGQGFLGTTAVTFHHKTRKARSLAHQLKIAPFAAIRVANPSIPRKLVQMPGLAGDDKTHRHHKLPPGLAPLS